jgi:hypothetical protein
MDDALGCVLGLVLVAGVIFLIVTFISAIATVAGGIGVLWGGGEALVNYLVSLKENLIDSNKKTI